MTSKLNPLSGVQQLLAVRGEHGTFDVRREVVRLKYVQMK